MTISEIANERLAKKAVKIIIAFDVGEAWIFLTRPVTNIIGVVMPPPPIPVTPEINPPRVPIPRGMSFEWEVVILCSFSWRIKNVRMAK